MQFDADLHLHGRFSGGVSKNLTFRDILEGSKKKGITLVGTGDILHPVWREEVKTYVIEEDDIYYAEDYGVYVLPTVEVEDRNRVHHIIILPSFPSAEELGELLKHHGDIESSGRPKLDVSGKELAEKVEDVGGLIGPAHAFTPYYGIYAHTDSVLDYYDKTPDFLELGLSADSYLANNIEELLNVPFQSNSDAHSGSPHRLGREFQRVRGRPSFKSIKRMDVIFNAGFNPQEGKYHMTACNRCYKKYTVSDAERLEWRCICGGRIKKGVKDRIAELTRENIPYNRPPYYHIVPLIQVIEVVKKYGQKRAEDMYNAIIDEFDSEIKVLFDVPVEELISFDEQIGSAIDMMRKGKILYYPGGGGKYGEVYIPLTDEEYEKLKYTIEARLKKELSSRQTSLFDFV